MKAPLTPETGAYRARYLKLKSVLHDRATGLPAVPVLLERLRAQLDQRRALGVLNLSLANVNQVESLYGWQVLDRVLSRVASELREACGAELPGGSLLAIDTVAGDRFAIFLIEQHDGREVDAAFLEACAEALRGRIVASLDSDEFAGLGPDLGVRLGHALLSRNPFFRFERCVWAAIAEAAGWEERRRSRRARGLAQELAQILDQASVATLFQPVVDLRTRGVLGYEALSRGPADSPFADPRVLFDASGVAGRAEELDRLCRAAALRAVGRIGTPGKVFLNTLQSGLADDGAEQSLLLATLHDLALDASDLVLEFSEREVGSDPEQFAGRLDRLKQRGFGVALDDLGTGYASQALLEGVRPDFLKLDGSLVRNVEDNLIKQEVVVSLIRIAAQVGSSVIAEGIESEAESAALLRAGAQFGQGFLFAEPAAAETFLATGRPGREH